MKQILLVAISLLLNMNLIFCQEVEDNNQEQEDYWKLSSRLFSILIGDESCLEDNQKYVISSQYFSNVDVQKDTGNQKEEFLHSGPYEILKFSITLLKCSEKEKKSTAKKIDDFTWSVWNCGDENEKIKNPIEIESKDLEIKYTLINSKPSKRLKKEKYLISYSGKSFVLEIKCLKGFKFYKDSLKKELFIKRIFDKINYYHPKYGCVEVIPLK